MNTCRCRENVRIAITKENDIIEWFEAKAATRGMLTHVAQVDQRGVDYFYKGKRRLVFHTLVCLASLKLRIEKI